MSQLKHSELGIVSFATSIVAGLEVLMTFGVAGVMESSTPGGMDENSAGAILVGLAVIGLILTLFVALGFGVAGILQNNRKRIFAILGTCFSGVILIGSVAVMLIGLALDQ